MERERCEELLTENLAALERWVHCRIPDRPAAEDLIQEICLSVLRHSGELRNPEAFRPWLYRIARNKLTDRCRETEREIPFERMDSLAAARRGSSLHEAVAETLEKLEPSDRELLILCYMDGVPQKEAALRYGIPEGTLKSRLSAARRRFRQAYPYTRPNRSVCSARKKEEKKMKKRNEFPLTMPDYELRLRDDEPFPVVHEGIIGWGVVPRLGQECGWASYDFPAKTITNTMHMRVTGKIMVHGIEGVEIETVESGWASPDNLVFSAAEVRRTFAAQLTDTHVRLLAEMHEEDGVKKLYTFLDGPDFLDNWGYGEDNCGMETHLSPKGLLVRTSSGIENRTDGSRAVIDVCGRFDVTILGRTYDTVCLTDAESYDAKVLTETYLDRDGRIVLWRRFNRNDWGRNRIGQLWTERYPDNERLTVNGETYVHWYDCLYDNMLE